MPVARHGEEGRIGEPAAHLQEAVQDGRREAMPFGQSLRDERVVGRVRERRPVHDDGRRGPGDERDDAQDDHVARCGSTFGGSLPVVVTRAVPRRYCVLRPTAMGGSRGSGCDLGRGMQEPMARSRSKSGVGLRVSGIWSVGRRLLPILGLGIVIAYWALTPARTVSDAMDYYLLDLADPYANPWGATHAFVYSPVYAQVLYPLTLLPFEAFYKVLMAINLGALLFLVGPVWAAVALPLAHPDMANGAGPPGARRIDRPDGEVAGLGCVRRTFESDTGSHASVVPGTPRVAGVCRSCRSHCDVGHRFSNHVAAEHGSAG